MDKDVSNWTGFDSTGERIEGGIHHEVYRMGKYNGGTKKKFGPYDAENK